MLKGYELVDPLAAGTGRLSSIDGVWNLAVAAAVREGPIVVFAGVIVGWRLAFGERPDLVVRGMRLGVRLPFGERPTSRCFSEP